MIYYSPEATTYSNHSTYTSFSDGGRTLTIVRILWISLSSIGMRISRKIQNRRDEKRQLPHFYDTESPQKWIFPILSRLFWYQYITTLKCLTFYMWPDVPNWNVVYVLWEWLCYMLRHIVLVISEIGMKIMEANETVLEQSQT